MSPNSAKIAGPLVLALMLATAALGGEPPTPRQPKRDTTADVVILKDGSAVLGEFSEFTHHGGILMIVRRDWAKTNQAAHLPQWEKAEEGVVMPAIAKRLERMELWKRDRENSKVPDDPGSKRLTEWIGKEVERLKGPEAVHASRLMLVKFGKDEVRGFDQAAKGDSRFLRLAWTANYRDPEDSTRDDLMASLEGRGFVLKQVTLPLIDAMLPPANTTDLNWRTKRAATELLHDSGLRFISFSGVVSPEPAIGQQADVSTLMAAAKSALGQLLGGVPEDQLQTTLAKLAETGRVGAVVTELIIEPDLANVSVEMTLWVRSAEGSWNRSGSRKATAGAIEVGNQEGNALAQDPQVSAIFKVAESLGLGEIGQELKQRSLNVGAATKKALGQARELANDDLEALALPID